jgi:hypothetical protein
MGLRRAGTARSAEAPNVFPSKATCTPMATNAAGRARPPEASGRSLSTGTARLRTARPAEIDCQSSSREGMESGTGVPVRRVTIRGMCTWQVSTITLTRRSGVPAIAVPATKTPGTFVSIVSGS